VSRWLATAEMQGQLLRSGGWHPHDLAHGDG